MQTREFANKIAVITGAAGGLGQALCHCFAKKGAKVIALDIVESQFPVGIISYKCDITNANACQETFEHIQQNHGQIDVLINNAGITHLSSFLDTELTTIKKVMDVNFFGTIYCTKAALAPLIKSQGMIINISSVAGFSPLLYRTGYAASKHALHGFFATLRTELQDKNVSVMMVCPAFINTGIRQKASNDGTQKPGNPQNTVGKKHSPQEVAQKIYIAAQKNKRLLLIGSIAHYSYWLYKLLPAFFEKLMIKRVRF